MMVGVEKNVVTKVTYGIMFCQTALLKQLQKSKRKQKGISVNITEARILEIWAAFPVRHCHLDVYVLYCASSDVCFAQGRIPTA